MSTMSGGSAIVAVVTASAVPAAQFGFDPRIFWTVVVPVVASWFGLIGIGVLSERPLKHILRQLVGTVLLGFTVGIVAWAAIAAVKAEGIFAALVTLTIAVSPAVIWKSLGSAGPRVLDSAMGAIGFERKKEQDDGS